MKPVRDHFRVHGGVHAIWIISVLVLLNAALLLIQPNGEAVGEYIAFATSIASLVLAVVAIGYSFIANQSFSEMVGSLRTSADDVKTAATNVSDVSKVLSGQSERIIQEVTSLPPAMKEINEKLDLRFSPNAVTRAGPAELDVQSIDMDFDAMSNGVRISLYVIVRAYATQKAVDPPSMVNSSVWVSWITGAIRVIESFQPCGIQLRELADKKLMVDSLGRLDPLKIERTTVALDTGSLVTVRADIDRYFATEDSISDSALKPE